MIKTQVDFVIGPDPSCAVPPPVEIAAPDRQFAIIQHTYRPDYVDMFFDEPLWLRLLEFARAFDGGHEVRIMDNAGLTKPVWDRGPGRPIEVAAEDFLAAWTTSAAPYKEPPAAIIVRDETRVLLCIATEYWTLVGGLAPYYDSYTYSAFAQDDVSDAIIAFLKDTDAAHGWTLASSASQAVT